MKKNSDKQNTNVKKSKKRIIMNDSLMQAISLADNVNQVAEYHKMILDDKKAEWEKDRIKIKKKKKAAMEAKVKAKQKRKALQKKSANPNMIKPERSEISVEKEIINEKEALNKTNSIIGIKDFVVRRSAFKCMHNQHTIKNIEAVVKVMRKRDGTIVDKKVSAGFCEECNTYFIMESTFENIKKYGIPLCRVSDEKTYLSNSQSNDIQMAQESVLMQFGYNVGQNEGLTESIRQRILAIIIDNKILSKPEIIGYLDFFISQRITQHKYEIAISKWEKDKEFVSGYRQGEFTQYGVNAIYR